MRASTVVFSSIIWLFTAMICSLPSCRAEQKNQPVKPANQPLESVRATRGLPIRATTEHYSNEGMLVADAGAVSCKTREAAEAGLRMLKAGGNAVDAIVATGLAMSVVSTGGNSLGGYGGAMVIKMHDQAEPEVIDFATRAPLAATADMFATREEIQGYSVRTVTTWNAIAGLYVAHERLGSKSWQEVIAPAIELAEQGFILSATGARAIERAFSTKFQQSPASLAIYSRPNGGGPLRAGDRLVQPDLARSLRLLAQEGADVLYTGVLAERMVAHIQKQGGLIRMEDLADWRKRHVRVGSAAHVQYRGYDIYTSPILSGGQNLLAILNLLAGFDLKQKGYSADSLHHMLESFKIAWADRLWYAADPWAKAVPYEGMMSRSYADGRRSAIDPTRAASHALPGHPAMTSAYGDAKLGEPKRPEGDPGRRSLFHRYVSDTASFSSVDANGSMVALTSTMRSIFGSGITVPGTGITLNNGMGLFLDDLDSGANRVEGGKLAVNNMNAFLIMRDGKPYVTAGGAGGRRIMTECASFIVHMIDWNADVHRAVNAPRFHVEYQQPASIEAALPKTMAKELRALGHELRELRVWGRVHAIAIDPSTGHFHVARDERMGVSTAAGLRFVD